jgi:hypothetical protein
LPLLLPAGLVWELSEFAGQSLKIRSTRSDIQGFPPVYSDTHRQIPPQFHRRSSSVAIQKSMIYSVSQAPAIRQNNRNHPSAAEMPGTPNFSRNRVDSPAGHSTKAHPVDGNRQRAVYEPIAHGAKPVQFAHGPCRIPSSTEPGSPALTALRDNCKAMLSSLDHLHGIEARNRGIPFMTRNGEAGLVKKENNGMASILVNGKTVVQCFNDIHYPGDTHIMMAGPGNKMYAGRYLPQDYLAEANALVQSANNSISNQGQVQNQMRRWG